MRKGSGKVSSSTPTSLQPVGNTMPARVTTSQRAFFLPARRKQSTRDSTAGTFRPQLPDAAVSTAATPIWFPCQIVETCSQPDAPTFTSCQLDQTSGEKSALPPHPLKRQPRQRRPRPSATPQTWDALVFSCANWRGLDAAATRFDMERPKGILPRHPPLFGVPKIHPLQPSPVPQRDGPMRNNAFRRGTLLQRAPTFFGSFCRAKQKRPAPEAERRPVIAVRSSTPGEANARRTIQRREER